MIKLLHCADLHLKKGLGDYGLEVLKEITDAANSEKADFLLICGDLFDSFSDAEVLHRRVAAIMNVCAAEAIYIPGNHEEHGKNGSIANFDFGKLRPLMVLPFSILTRNIRGEDIEFLTVPHQRGYANWRAWGIPARKARTRLSLVHAVIENMVFTGPDSSELEEDGGILGPEFFAINNVCYAALGHIHDSRTHHAGDADLVYPGSATVWRKGELGPRKAMLIEIDGSDLSYREKVLAKAGQYRQLEIPLSLDGRIPDFGPATGRCGPHDLVELRLTGIVEDEIGLRDVETAAREAFKHLIRPLMIDRESVAVFPGLAAQPLASSFLKLWQEGPQPAGAIRQEVWSRARELALLAIRERMEEHS